MLTPIRNSIIFAFRESTTNGKFLDKSDSGIILGTSTTNDMVNRARWATVVAVGPDVQDPNICAGATVLIEPLQWTTGFVHDGVQIWKTDESKILALRN